MTFAVPTKFPSSSSSVSRRDREPDLKEPAIVRPSAAPNAPRAAVDTGTVWVTARHSLVAQALAAALGRRVRDVRILDWDGLDPHTDVLDAPGDLLLVVDDLESPTAVASVRSLVLGVAARTVVMTELVEGATWGALLGAGATEVVSELASVEQLAQVLGRVAADEPVMPPDRRAELCALWDRQVTEDQALVDRMATLSPREKAVLHTLAAGCRPAEIGQHLGVTEATVRTHLRSIRGKLGVDSQLKAALVVHRLESRVPPLEPDMPWPRLPLD